MEADWDLHAVVRGCSSFTSPAHPSDVSPIHRDEGSLSLVCREPFLATRRSTFEELHPNPLYQPFLPKPEPFSWHNTPLSSCSSSLASSLFKRTKSSLSSLGHVQTPPASFRAGSQASKSKKRKKQQKKVCEVPVEGVSSDVWAWRKYGQKPIKGSPFPRSYYRCSSSKGCLARKHVERNGSDPGMFIITYMAEHNHPAPAHRNSFAGVWRQKQPSAPEIMSSDSNVQAETSYSSPYEEKEVVLWGGDSPDKDGVETEDMSPSGDYFMGMEGFVGDSWDPFGEFYSYPWTASNAAAAAAAGEC